MTDPVLVTEIRKLFTEKLLVEVPSPDTDLLETGALDSASLVEMLLHLEERFGVRLSIEELEIAHFRSLNSIAELVGTRKEAISY